MEKKEFQALIKDKLKKLGFQSRGNIYYNLIEDDYLVRVELVHSSYYKAYSICYGVRYEPSEKEPLYKQWLDWSGWFYFSKEIGDDLSKYHIEDYCRIWLSNAGDIEKILTDEFQYDIRSIEELNHSIDENIEKRLKPAFDKNYPLDIYRKIPKELVYMSRGYDSDTEVFERLNRLIRLGNFDKDKIYNMHARWMNGEIISNSDYFSD